MGKRFTEGTPKSKATKRVPKPGLKLGRPCILNEELIGKFDELLRAGLHIEPTCALLGVTRETFYDWLSKGEHGFSPLHTLFSDSVKTAIAHAEFDLLQDVKSKGLNWQATAWVMERRFRQRWARTWDGPPLIQTSLQPPEVQPDEES